MRYEARGIDIGHLEYTVGPSGASSATAVSVAVIPVYIIVYVYSVLR